MVKVVIQTFHKVAPKGERFTFPREEKFEEVTVNYDCYSRSQLLAALLYARWQLEKFHNHSNVDLFYNGNWYFGAI